METDLTYCMARSGIVPIREKPSDAAEMVNQMILGETAEVVQIQDRWLHIETGFDRYKGWINRSQVEVLEDSSYREWLENPGKIRSPYFRFFIKNDRETLCVPAGSVVVLKDDNVILPTGVYKVTGPLNLLKGPEIIDTAKGFLGTPYLWGGRTDLGIDCSGLVQAAFALHGWRIPRDSRVQYRLVAHSFRDWSRARPGDVAYFSTQGERITHVGFYAGNGLLLHASGNVRFSRIIPSGMLNLPYAFEERLASGLIGIQSAAEIKEYCDAIPYYKATR